MTAQLAYWKDRLRSSFWPVPALITLTAIGAAFAMVWLDNQPWGPTIAIWGGGSTGDADGARLVLSTIAGSMITVASLVFSMTLVALTLAAGNIGPRLIDRFMDNRINQIALGVFLATFVYSLLVLKSIRGEGTVFIPHLSINLALLMAIFSFGWLIYFIHDLARSIQVDNVIAKVAAELEEALDKIATRYPEAMPVPVSGRVPGTPIAAGGTGYIQAIGVSTLIDLATDHDLVITLPRRPGHFVIPSTIIAECVGDTSEKTAGEIKQAFVLGPKRTSAQDFEYHVNLIVEVAARALSPGVNDFQTALTCVDQLTAAIHGAFRNGLPHNGFQDDVGKLRLVLNTITLEGLCDAAFHPLRQAAAANVSVLIRLLESFTLLAGDHHDRIDVAHRLLAYHGHLIHEAAMSGSFADVDRRTIEDRYTALRAKLELQKL
jgi:uncharacterized membrane protein